MLLQVAKHNESYTIFFMQIWTYDALVVKVSSRECGNLGLTPDKFWNALLSLGHFAWHWASQCTDMRAFHIAALSVVIFSP